MGSLKRKRTSGTPVQILDVICGEWTVNKNEIFLAGGYFYGNEKGGQITVSKLYKDQNLLLTFFAGSKKTFHHKLDDLI
jgi:hypothetical protein